MQKSRRVISRDKNLEAEATKKTAWRRELKASQKTIFMNTIYPTRQLSLTFEFLVYLDLQEMQWTLFILLDKLQLTLEFLVYLDLPEMLRTEEHCNPLK